MATAPSPGAKKPRTNTRVESSVDSLLDDAEDKDFLYVQRCLFNQPRLSALVASWLRDGELDRALARKDSRDVRAVLGAPLATRCKKMKGIPPRVFKAVWRGITDPDPLSGETFEPEDSEPLDMQTVIIPLLMWAMRTTPEAPIPSTHEKAGFEGPLYDVLMARYTEQGRILDGITYAKVGEYGKYFCVNKDDKTKIDFKSGKAEFQIQLPFANDYMKGLTELRIASNHLLREAELVEPSQGFSQNLFVMLQKQHPTFLLKHDDEGWEIADAAKRFVSVVMPKAAMTAASSSGAVSSGDGATTSAAKKKATPKKRAPKGKAPA